MKKSIAFILVLCICAVFLTACVDDEKYWHFIEYCDASNWSCDNETFISRYHKLYLYKAAYLMHQYGLDCAFTAKYSGEWSADLDILLYCERYTILLVFFNIEGESFATYHAWLFYYGDENGFGEYEDFKPLVEFLNDFTNYVAYDARDDQNHFERLYYEALSDEIYYSASYYLDHVIRLGDVGYSVNLVDDRYGYYYMLCGDHSLEKICYYFGFEGLLKPIPDT